MFPENKIQIFSAFKFIDLFNLLLKQFMNILAVMKLFSSLHIKRNSRCSN